MEKFRISMGVWQDRLDCCWKQLPAPQKRRIVLYSFIGYVLITIAIVVQIIYEVGSAREDARIEHITNPMTRQDAGARGTIIIQEFKQQDNEGEQERESKLPGQ